MISLDPDVLEHPNTSIPDKGTIDNRPYRKSVVYEITFRGGATVVYEITFRGGLCKVEALILV